MDRKLSADNPVFDMRPADDRLCLHIILKKREAEHRAWAGKEAAADSLLVDRATPSSPDSTAEGQGRVLEGPQCSCLVRGRSSDYLRAGVFRNGELFDA